MIRLKGKLKAGVQPSGKVVVRGVRFPEGKSVEIPENFTLDDLELLERSGVEPVKTRKTSKKDDDENPNPNPGEGEGEGDESDSDQEE